VIKRCEDSIRQLQTIEKACEGFNLKVNRIDNKIQLFNSIREIVDQKQTSEQVFVDHLEDEIKKKYDYVKGQ
jgi:hypothetical protein